jgi:HK97 family phage portal protein
VKPNSLQSGLEYRETVGLHLALSFNHYSYISRVGNRVDELLPISPQYVTSWVDKSTGEWRMKYKINWPTGGVSILEQEDIWHIRGPSWEPGIGMDAIRLLREAVGLAIATEETHARFHSNGAQPGGTISTDKDLSSQDIRDRLKEEFGQRAGGVANKFKTIVLDNGLKWTPIQPSGVDSQHVQLRQFQVEEICRGFCVMPIMVGYSGDKAPTFASAEQLFLQHLVHTVRPWHRRFTESADRWLLTDEDKAAGYYVAFVEADYLSPDLKAKAEFYRIALGGSGNPGWMKPSEVRSFEELPPHVGSDNLYAPGNIGPIQADGRVLGAVKDETTNKPQGGQ